MPGATLALGQGRASGVVAGQARGGVRAPGVHWACTWVRTRLPRQPLPWSAAAPLGACPSDGACAAALWLADLYMPGKVVTLLPGYKGGEAALGLVGVWASAVSRRPSPIAWQVLDARGVRRASARACRRRPPVRWAGQAPQSSCILYFKLRSQEFLIRFQSTDLILSAFHLIL